MAEYWECKECSTLYDDSDGDTDEKMMCNKCIEKIYISVKKYKAIGGYKAGMLFTGKTGEEPIFNAQVFATRQEADIAGNELVSRWMLPIGFKIVQVNQDINYRIDNGKPVRIGKIEGIRK
jgi:rubredoxin